MDHLTAEINRCLQNLIRLGVVAEVDHDNARARVTSGDLTTGWLPWLTQRAGDAVTWWAPSVGEQVVILSPGGDLAAGVMMSGIYSNAVGAPSASPSIATTHYPDGAVIEYDHASHALSATLPGGSSATVTATSVVANADQVTSNAPETTCTGNLTVENNLTVNGHSSLNAGLSVSGSGGGGSAAVINGSVQVSDDVTAAGISLIHHVHGGVWGGDGNTGAPQ